MTPQKNHLPIASVKVKIFTLIFVTVIALSVALWFVMVNVIQNISEKNHLNFSKKEFIQLEKTLYRIEESMAQNSEVIVNDVEITLAVNLLDRYDTLAVESRSVFDAQKSNIATILQRYREISNSDALIVLNSKKEVLSFSKSDKTGYQSFIQESGSVGTFYDYLGQEIDFTPSKNLKTLEPNTITLFAAQQNLYAKKLVPIYANQNRVGYLVNVVALDSMLFEGSACEHFCSGVEYNGSIYLNDASCKIDDSAILQAIMSQSAIENLYTIENRDMFIYSYTPTKSAISLLYITSKDEYYSALSSMQKKLFILFVLITLIVALLSYIFTQKIFISPFKKLYEGFKKIQKGDFNHQIHLSSKDELQQLADEFNTMSHKIYSYDKEKTKNYEEVILALVDIIEQRDTYTAGHSKRVAHYCELIAHGMGLSENLIQKIKKAAMLHDIGKVQTPDTILLKPARLSRLEYTLIKEHVTISDAILKKLSMYKDLAEIVKYHHERHDGKGYPYGKQGDDIPLLSRIMIVADAFDAMTTNRIYKPRLCIDEAIKELQRNSATQFDPEVVTVAANVLKDVEIPDTGDQLPHTDIEKERFSYFFKDPLTQSYNIDYLNTILNKDDLQDSFAYVIMLRNFSKYNSSYGWDEGDRYLISFTHYISQLHPDGLLFRIEGDDFILIADKIDIEDVKDFENDIVNFDIISMSLKQVSSFDDIKKILKSPH